MENSSFNLTKENEAKATKPELEFIFSHMEKQLIESLKSADDVLNRSTILLGILFAILTSIIGYLAANIKTGIHDPFFWSLGVVLLYNGFIIDKIRFNIKGATYGTVGREAKNVFHNEYFDKYADPDLRERRIYIDCIDRYQSSIEHNNSINKGRWLCFRECLTLTVYIPVIFIGIYAALFTYSLI